MDLPWPITHPERPKMRDLKSPFINLVLYLGVLAWLVAYILWLENSSLPWFYEENWPKIDGLEKTAESFRMQLTSPREDLEKIGDVELSYSHLQSASCNSSKDNFSPHLGQCSTHTLWPGGAIWNIVLLSIQLFTQMFWPQMWTFSI